MSEELTYHVQHLDGLNTFDGPLDLLLNLIEKNKVEITNIPIELIFEQYMAYLEEAQRMDLEIACEFILMASQLMLIKSRMLLPRDEENEEDPRQELADALLIYQQAKKNADELRPLYAAYSGRMAKDTDEIPPERGLPLGLNPSLLSAAMNKMLLRIREQEKAPAMVNPLLKVKIVNVGDRMGRITAKLEAEGEVTFFDLMKDFESRSELIASFMGILELIKIGRILFLLEEEDDDITLAVKFRLNPDYVPTEGGSSEFDGDQQVHADADTEEKEKK